MKKASSASASALTCCSSGPFPAQSRRSSSSSSSSSPSSSPTCRPSRQEARSGLPLAGALTCLTALVLIGDLLMLASASVSRCF
eukprot:CAMPEP_0206469822 /NCGR_PEP_ID=MMETSP0324_2-20121206/30527_1 /ASSEMBLY_ACC=CAM_ASM_000836 /TAXON_ID=2866 /ORGANISM="Crypthecodinium cohnii, Strain Seligo" /LENGTH=83 /DNA_ID=CAMNT_0053943691 /DNA_START=211 /DNA_END=462 /DNA_ORIENTATION=-